MSKSVLQKGQIFDGKYAVNFFLKKGNYAESYRVQNEKKEIKFLKLFDYKRLHRTQLNASGEIIEINILGEIKHPNLLKFVDAGEIIDGTNKYAYAVLDFISGETLTDKLKRDETLSHYDAKDIILGVLNGLQYLHSHKPAIIHNDITPQNVMVDLSGKVSIAKIIDFGYARYISQSIKEFTGEGLNPFYCANETFNNVFSVQSDIFSVGALYYHLLMGMPPYFIQISDYKANRVDAQDLIIKQRSKPLRFSNDVKDDVKAILSKALATQPEDRFESANEFIQAINGELLVQMSEDKIPEKKPKSDVIKKGNGFSAIAGMEELKETIRVDIIDALNKKQEYEEYGLSIPNGMLLYGPPGCGKTFFAEKMAEEIGFSFYQIKPSDIQSKWVNASQENIKNLFDEARENAPSIIFIDELDALVPDRDTSNISHMNTTAVNEFLAQMNNCGEDGLFVVGATNRPNAIDPAVLRSGRLDKHVYLPPPDFEAREKMFRIYLEKRPTDLGINYSKIAEKTENYVSSDIKLIADQASREALKNKSKITEEIILNVIKNTKSSLSKSELQKFITIKEKFEGNDYDEQKDRNRIGFKK